MRRPVIVVVFERFGLPAGDLCGCKGETTMEGIKVNESVEFKWMEVKRGGESTV